MMMLTAILLTLTAYSQKFLQIEKYGSPKTTKFYPGDDLVFQLGDDTWITRTILDVNADRGTILIEDVSSGVPMHLDVQEITNVKLGSKGKIWRIVGKTLMAGGANIAISSLFLARSNIIPPIKDYPQPYIYGAGNFLLGLGIDQLLGKPVYKMGRRYHLRVLDLTIY
ncbi:MAG: hypothetical protein H6561_14775 [Lewinellaceae bacterium]|nr:hypothetical protein [Saprospiraceae bacterium]MCB9270811.1 hypothetical protein [Lewinellaceae bacterium]HQU52724.1 hypothetical protein [Saprospiraceae bacterium]